jgi:hypothetical protein
MDSGANCIGKPEAFPGTIKRLRAKLQRSQFPANRFGCRLPTLTALRPHRVDDVGQLTAEHLRSPPGVARKQQTLQNDRSELSRGVNADILVALAQELNDAELQVFVVGNTGP